MSLFLITNFNPIHRLEELNALKNRVESGDIEAMFDLAIDYAIGEDIDQNLEYSFFLFKTSAERGYFPSFYEYGACLIDGIGCNENEALGLEWVNRGASLRDKEALFALAFWQLEGHPTKKHLVPIVPKKAVDKLYNLINLGFTEARIHLGRCFMKGLGVEKNKEIGAFHFSLAAQLGHQIDPGYYQQLLSC